jgi:structural toxin protein (hemagglutinin/hemolysin) RtxA
MYMFFVYIPESYVEEVKQAMFSAGAGKIGNYSCCSWQVKGEGQFCPEVGSDAYIGQVGIIEKIVEYKVAVVCENEEVVRNVIMAMKRAHPYEMPAYGVVKLENF